MEVTSIIVAFTVQTHAARIRMFLKRVLMIQLQKLTIWMTLMKKMGKLELIGRISSRSYEVPICAIEGINATESNL